MQRPTRLALLLLLVAGAACAPKIRVDVDPAEDFSGYQHWAWLPRRAEARGSDTLKPAYREQIQRAIERELSARGLTRVEESEADFFVTYHAALNREIHVRRENPAATQLDSLHQSPSYVVQGSEQRVATYEEVRLVVDVADSRERQLVWRGRTERRDRGTVDRHLDEVVAAIFDHFPVQAP
jgi:hypothetical protein